MLWIRNQTDVWGGKPGGAPELPLPSRFVNPEAPLFGTGISGVSSLKKLMDSWTLGPQTAGETDKPLQLGGPRSAGLAGAQLVQACSWSLGYISKGAWRRLLGPRYHEGSPKQASFLCQMSYLLETFHGWRVKCFWKKKWAKSFQLCDLAIWRVGVRRRAKGGGEWDSKIRCFPF